MQLPDIYSFITAFFVIASVLSLLTYFKVSSIIARDGPAKIEVNKQFEGVLLDHAERIERTSPLYLPFLLNFFPLGNTLFFKDFQDEGYRLNIAHWAGRVILALLAYNLLYLEGFTDAALATGAFIVVQSLSYTKLSMYYYLRYNHVSFMVELEEDEEIEDDDR